jgi:hypothetical protein
MLNILNKGNGNFYKAVLSPAKGNVEVVEQRLLPGDTVNFEMRHYFMGC